MKRTSGASVVVLAAFAIVVAWLGWRSLGWPLVHDAPIMHYIAWRMADGAVPYRDLFDMNVPGVYLLHLGVITLAGTGDVAWRAFDLTWLAMTAAVIAAMAAPWGVAAAAGGALFFAAYHLAAGAWNAGQRDFVLCPFLLLAALGVSRWLEGLPPGRRWPLVGAGLAAGAAITVKPHAAIFAAILTAVVAGAAWRAKQPLWPPALTLAGAAVVIPGSLAAWLAVTGGLAAWRDILFGYLLPLYSRLGRPPQWTFHRWPVWIVIGVAVLGSLALAVRRGRGGARHAIAAAGLGYGVIHFFGQGKGWEYHLYPLAAFAAVLACAEIDARGRPRRLAVLALAGAMVLTAAMLGIKGAEAADPPWIAEKLQRVDAVVAGLTGRVRPGDRVQVLDTSDGGIHALLRLGIAQPTRFLYDFHFYHHVGTEAIRRLRAELVADLAASPPRLIVLFERGWPAGGYERVAAFPELARILAEYPVQTRGDGYVIYAK